MTFRNPIWFGSICAAVLLLCTVPAAASEGSWQVGTAKTEITPDGPLLMAGYASRDTPCSQTLLPLWAKAMVLEDRDHNLALLITLDLVGIDRELSKRIVKQISEQHEISPSGIALCVSHTHTGPVVGKNLGPMHYRLATNEQRRAIDDYQERLQQTVVRLVGLALKNRSPCRLVQGLGHADFAVNRRNNPADQVPARRRLAELAGPTDHSVPVLAVRDQHDRLKVVVFGYACHATVLDSVQWSGDYPGYAQAELERRHDGCQAMFWAGCGADQNPLPRRTVELAKHYGDRLATAVDAVLLTSQMGPLAPTLETIHREVPLALGARPTVDQLQSQSDSGNRFQKSRADMWLQRIEAGQPLPADYPYPVATWVLGGKLRWIFLGGEVVVDYSLRLRDQLGSDVWVTAYANDVMAYIPSRRVLREGGYEGDTSMIYYGLPTVWAPTIEQQIVDEAVRQAAGH
ncbi:neutral/alkaline non-lysosomal ceramidase N-terminal domain-containing protein [Roseiconus nitratireducens]|uniref:neutral/alkaline non-lysosomal ceramidase N-terminal domain-containing protein n=1 Tax=Roseiconus nitratireducens TaxID=2605748 RepID=UPI001375909E|nr:neutral/alkaline non-lysosomal ceramidase N-terminal domain-containing protein [Roseiconus nitratireducens]